MKNNFIIVLTFFVLIIGQSCKKDADTKKNIIEDSPVMKKSDFDKKATVNLQSINNSEAFGSVQFKEKNNQVTLITLVNSLGEGNYNMYITNNKDCSGLDENKSMHWNPTNKEHGLWGDKLGYHKGDIGAFKADMLGNGTLSFSTDEWCIGCDDNTKNIVGKTIIVVKDSKNENNIVLTCGLIEEVKS